MNHKHLVVYLAALSVAGSALAFTVTGAVPRPDLTLWYQQPAADSKPMNEALPIGNGRMGALVFGSPERERVSVNESSLWTGGENPSGNYDTMGAYQVLGNIYLNLPAHAKASNYRRNLSLDSAVSGVSYQVDGVTFNREFFCSHPAEVLVAQFQEGRKGGYTGSLELNDSHHAKLIVDGNRITAAGSLDNGMKFEWQVLVLNQGGTVSAVADTNSMRLDFKDCDSLTLLIGAGTDYIFDFAKHYHGDDPHARVTAQIDAAAKRSAAELKAEHIRDYQALFYRVSADFGHSSEAQTALPTDQRKLKAFAAVDPGLEALQFQYGPLSFDFLFASRRFAGEFAGVVERQQQSAMA